MNHQGSSQSADHQYRQEVERVMRGGILPETARGALEGWRESLGLTPAAARAIEVQVLHSHHTFEQNMAQYEQQLRAAWLRESPLSNQTLDQLKHLQVQLGLQDEDISPVIARVVSTTDAAARPARKPPQPAAKPRPADAAPPAPRPADAAVPRPAPADAAPPVAPVRPAPVARRRSSRMAQVLIGAGVAVTVGVVGAGGLLLWQTRPKVQTMLYFETVQSSIMRWKNEWAINVKHMQEIDRVLRVADDLQTARSEADKITFPSWQRNAYSIIAQKKQQIEAFQKSKAQPAVIAQPSPQPSTVAASAPSSACFIVTQAGGTDVREDDDPVNDGKLGKVISRLASGTIVSATTSEQTAWSADGHELIDWVNIKKPVSGWVAKTQVAQTACSIDEALANTLAPRSN